jgi:glycosidase
MRHAFAEGHALQEIPKTLSRDYLYTNPEVLVTLLGGHDDGRFMSEKGATIAGLKLANTFLLTTRGVPQLYYGDEIAMTGADEPTTRRDFPGGFRGDTRDAFTPAGRTREQQEIFEHIKKLISIRREVEPLRTGKLVNLFVTEQQYAYARVAKSVVVIIAINNDSQPARLEFSTAVLKLPNGSIFRDYLNDGKEMQIDRGKLSFGLPARSAAILLRR